MKTQEVVIKHVMGTQRKRGLKKENQKTFHKISLQSKFSECMEKFNAIKTVNKIKLEHKFTGDLTYFITLGFFS